MRLAHMHALRVSVGIAAQGAWAATPAMGEERRVQLPVPVSLLGFLPCVTELAIAPGRSP